MEILLNAKHGEYIIGSLEPIYIYKVSYQYITKRNNKKSKIQKIIASDKFEAKCKFLEHVNEFNNAHAYRELTNVKILGITCIDEIKLSA